MCIEISCRELEILLLSQQDIQIQTEHVPVVRTLFRLVLFFKVYVLSTTQLAIDGIRCIPFKFSYMLMLSFTDVLLILEMLNLKFENLNLYFLHFQRLCPSRKSSTTRRDMSPARRWLSSSGR